MLPSFKPEEAWKNEQRLADIPINYVRLSGWIYPHKHTLSWVYTNKLNGSDAGSAFYQVLGKKCDDFMAAEASSIYFSHITIRYSLGLMPGAWTLDSLVIHTKPLSRVFRTLSGDTNTHLIRHNNKRDENPAIHREIMPRNISFREETMLTVKECVKGSTKEDYHVINLVIYPLQSAVLRKPLKVKGYQATFKTWSDHRAMACSGN
ncbi:hypothetical protein BDZ97DRAFT_1753764 [Flammula alnicola]|nr:hypothetical protein BDZ97DRAFT_1753764 [Flammula alnicola]